MVGSCVYSPAGVGGAEGRRWEVGGVVDTWGVVGGARLGGSCVRAACPFPGTGDADRPGADTVVCGGVRHPGVLGARRACGRMCHRDAAEDTV